MACDEWTDAISASVDGEDPGIDQRLLDAHLATCPACRSTRDALADLRRRARLQPAEPMPDLSARVVKMARVSDRRPSWRLVRIFLAVVAVQIIVLALPALLFGEEHGASAHAARHLGAFSIAYAAGLLVVALRPARARSILPVTAVLVGALVIGAFVDIVQGRVPLIGEVAHLPEVVSAVLVWALAVPVPRPGAGGARHPAVPRLRLLDRGDRPEEQAG